MNVATEVQRTLDQHQGETLQINVIEYLVSQDGRKFAKGQVQNAVCGTLRTHGVVKATDTKGTWLVVPVDERPKPGTTRTGQRTGATWDELRKLTQIVASLANNLGEEHLAEECAGILRRMGGRATS